MSGFGGMMSIQYMDSARSSVRYRSFTAIDRRARNIGLAPNF